MPKPSTIGREGEHTAAGMLRSVFLNVNRDDVPKAHPTKDLAHTGEWTVQVKRRKTWNIKDVVRHMEQEADGHWFIVYMDRDRRKKDNPQEVYAIPPMTEMVRLLSIEKHDDDRWGQGPMT